MTTGTEIQDCEQEVAIIRRNIVDAQSRRDGLLRRLEGLRRAIREIEERSERPGFRLRKLELEREMEAVQDELGNSRPELEMFRERLHNSERKCWELHRQKGGASATEDTLRRAIDDPRYWRDGDPEISRFVADGFKRLYPEPERG